MSRPLRIAIEWRALSETPSHFALLRELSARCGHPILALLEPPCPAGNSGPIKTHPVRRRFRIHPTVSFLTGWKRPLETFQPDVFLGLEEPYSIQSPAFLRWARKYRVPLILLTCQNIERRLPFPFEHVERTVLAGASGLWCLNSEAEQRARRRGFRGVSRVIPLGTDLPARVTERAGPSETFTVGYVGRLAREKGVSDLIAAAARVGARVVVAGAGPEEGALRGLARRLGVSADWLGWRSGESLAEVYPLLDALALPSHTTPTWKEQFGRVLIEAMGTGVPVVGSDSGEIPRVIGEAGLIYPEGDIAALTERLGRLQHDRGLWKDLSKRGVERVRDRFTWERISGMLGELIEETLARAVSPEAKKG